MIHLATDFQINAEALYLSGYPGFQYGYLAVTRDKYDSRNRNKWFMPTDRIVVIFKDKTISSSDLSAFIARNELKLAHAPDPSLPSGPYNWAYVFRLHQIDRFLPFEAAARIWMNGVSEDCEVSPEMTADAATNTPDALWHIRNNGGGIS